MLRKAKESQSGQALLIVVLVLAVSLIVVLSIASRTTSDISVSTYDENRLRAFSAAEAGVEEALFKNSSIGTADSPVSVDPNAGVGYYADLTAPSGDDQFNHPEPALSGQSRTFWMVSHTPGGALTCSGATCAKASQMEVCWGNPSTPDSSSTTPAIEVSLFYDLTRQSIASTNNYASIKTIRFTGDPWSSRRASNNFQAATPSCGFAASSYAFSRSINLSTSLPNDCPTSGADGCMLMVKVKILYNTTTAHPIGIKIVNTTGPGGILPAQGVQVSGVGTAGDSTSKVNVFRSYSEPQSIFDAGVFSYNDLTKN